VIRYEIGADHVGRITLDRPDAKNALTIEMRDGIVDAVRSARQDDNVRALLLTGAMLAALARRIGTPYPALVAYQERVRGRPSVQRAMTQEGLVKPQAEKVTT